uniref:Twisted gastrulation BMP signaling modulator 1 n=1 Tax=Rousettus aegyptiacus TaxID=9407 RepID=A0A7J8DMD3_ROUAE|nr:twisted gastrulation BMP signaling modulator 1 [Rousettus aegyptiacus]
MKSQSIVMLTLAILVFLTWVPVSLSCNKALCASDVSKCLIQELCQCRPGEGNCSCCKECMLCLGTLWDECCDCVGKLTCSKVFNISYHKVLEFKRLQRI